MVGFTLGSRWRRRSCILSLVSFSLSRLLYFYHPLGTTSIERDRERRERTVKRRKGKSRARLKAERSADTAGTRRQEAIGSNTAGFFWKQTPAGHHLNYHSNIPLQRRIRRILSSLSSFREHVARCKSSLRRRTSTKFRQKSNETSEPSPVLPLSFSLLANCVNSGSAPTCLADRGGRFVRDLPSRNDANDPTRENERPLQCHVIGNNVGLIAEISSSCMPNHVVAIYRWKVQTNRTRA